MEYFLADPNNPIILSTLIFFRCDSFDFIINNDAVSLNILCKIQD